MVSNTVFVIFMLLILSILAFLIRIRRGGKLHLMQKLYTATATCMVIWMLAIIAVKFTSPTDTTSLKILDAIMYIGVAGTPVMALLTALCFTNSLERLKKSYYWLFVIPIITNIMVWTNEYHHLFYREFSMVGTEVVYGPALFLSGVYSMICLVSAIVMMLRFAINSHTALYTKQALLYSVGALVPVIVSLVTTLRLVPPSIVATPLSFSATMLCNGIAIYRLHLFDISPVAMQNILNTVTDCYLVTNEQGLIVTYNQPFYEIFGKQHGMAENIPLSDCLKDEDVENKTGLHNLMTSIQSSRESRSSILYEQAISVQQEDGELQRIYFMVEVKPLLVEDRLVGFISAFKDVTMVKESMQKLQTSQVRLLERERLASLGQMMGGMAHNLKTPIMSVSGSATAADNLISECLASLRDPDVTQEDFEEIYLEMREWMVRIRDACSYMSDIITAVKGQATNMNVSDDADFTIHSVLERMTLLLRHELNAGGCTIKVVDEARKNIILHGDINNLVQVVNNLVTNAIHALENTKDKQIIIRLSLEEDGFYLTTEDKGVGMSGEVKAKLFKQMVTSKGTQGTGLGLYISNVVIRGKFGGTMWVKDNPGGGTVMGITFPYEHITVA